MFLWFFYFVIFLFACLGFNSENELETQELSVEFDYGWTCSFRSNTEFLRKQIFAPIFGSESSLLSVVVMNIITEKAIWGGEGLFHLTLPGPSGKQAEQECKQEQGQEPWRKTAWGLSSTSSVT